MHSQSLCVRLLLAYLIISPLFAVAQQSPGGSVTPDIWQATPSDSIFVGNYQTIDLHQITSSQTDIEFDRPSTLFFVLKPNFEDVTGELFLKIGEVEIYDSHIDLATCTIDFDVDVDAPIILTLKVQRPSRYGMFRDEEVMIGNTQLFSVAELIIYNEILPREVQRKVNSYLALKYSISITHNEQSQWRDYWSSGGLHYWDTRIDRVYDNRVLGIGRSDQENLYQSQTIGGASDDMWIALNHFEQRGTMPLAQIDDQSFIVFSEKNDESRGSITNCDLSEENPHPLTRWKFQLQSWSSSEKYLYIRIPDDQQKDDSLFLSDGRIIQYIPVSSKELDLITYRVDLEGLQDFRHYFFVTRNHSRCDDVDIVVNGNEISATLQYPEIDIWALEIQSLQDGNLSRHVLQGQSGSASVNRGQYLVSILDSGDQIIDSKVVWVDGESVSDADLVNIRVFPNPAAQNSMTTLTVDNLPAGDALRIVVLDAQGKVLDSHSLTSTSHVEQHIQTSVPGLYSVMIHQGSSIYAVKFVVSPSN